VGSGVRSVIAGKSSARKIIVPCLQKVCMRVL
jgi:hypothetical protein